MRNLILGPETTTAPMQIKFFFPLYTDLKLLRLSYKT